MRGQPGRAGGRGRTWPAPKHSHLLCVLMTLETSTLDSVATGFVSSHTEFWAVEPKAQWAQPCSWREPLGSCGRASDVVSESLPRTRARLVQSDSSSSDTDRPRFIFKENTARTWTCVKNSVLF